MSCGTKYIGYIRVSTKKQVDSGLSLEAQKKKIQQYAELFELELVNIIVDAGFTGKNLKRPGVQKCLAMLDSGEVQGMIITKLDRLSRSVRHTTQLIDKYFSEGSGKHLRSVNDNLDTTTPAGRMFINIMSSFAQYEAELIRERTLAGLSALDGKDNVKLGPTHYGVTRDPEVLVDGRMRLENDREELAVVDQIIIWRREGESYRSICDQLEARGIKTRKGRSKWQPMTVKRIYENYARAQA